MHINIDPARVVLNRAERRAAVSTFEFHYKPQGPTLDRYIQSTERRTFIRGPLGSSKTNASCWKLFRHMRGQAPDRNKVRRTRWIAVRNTYPDLFGTTIKDWLEMFGELGHFNKGGLEPPTHRLTFNEEDGTRVEAELVFLALDRPEHVRKLRGSNVTGGWLNEVKELPFAVVEMLDLRVGRFPVEVEPTFYGIFGDTNAPDTDHWYYRLAEEDRPEGWLFLTQPGGLIRDGKGAPWRVNPAAENLANLRPANGGYYLQGASGKGDDWILVNLANEYGFVRDGKPVHPDYRDAVHCRTFELDKALGLEIGLDFGLTPAATIGQRTVAGQWRVRSEVVMERSGVARFAGELLRHLGEKYPEWKVNSITGDPAGNQGQAGDSEERTVFQLLEAAGVYAKPAPGNNDFTLRVEAIDATLRRMIDGEPGYIIHPDCKVTRKGMQGGYCYKRVQISNDERYRDAPDKNRFSHPCEAQHYMALGAGEAKLVMPTRPPRAKLKLARPQFAG